MPVEGALVRFPCNPIETQTDTCIMKTKFTLFVTILAAALFLGGCASVTKPDVVHAVKWNGHWYAVFSDIKRSSPEAEEYCNKLGGHLVVISSEEENSFVSNLAKDTGQFGNYLIGALKKGTPTEAPKKDWQWINGEPFSTGYRNWGKGEASDFAHENRVCMKIGLDTIKNGMWASLRQDDSCYFICEWE